MEEKKAVKMLEDTETRIIKQQGWELNKVFVEEVSNSHKTYQDAMKYANQLRVKFNVAVRSVVHNKFHFVDVYKKKNDEI